MIYEGRLKSSRPNHENKCRLLRKCFYFLTQSLPRLSKYSLAVTWASLFDENLIAPKCFLDSEKNNSPAGSNQENKQFQVTIMDFSHRLHG